MNIGEALSEVRVWDGEVWIDSDDVMFTTPTGDPDINGLPTWETKFSCHPEDLLLWLLEDKGVKRSQR